MEETTPREHPLSEKQVHKLGSRIRNAYGDGTGVIAEEDLCLLQDFRMTYKDAIGRVFNVLYAIGHSVDPQCIVTYRIKRINSIVGKLKRFPETPLNRLIDIAGCRCITANTEQVYQIFDRLQAAKDITILRVKDNIREPQPEGYRSLHIYVTHAKCPDKQIEIQLRDIEQHNWATLVEISDMILQSKLKEYSEPADLLEFHRILSIPDSDWSPKERAHYFAMLDKYRIIDHMHKVFAQNILVRYDWMRSQDSAINHYYLIKVGENYQTSILNFRTFKEAEEAYFKCFALDGNSNIVLTQIQKASFEQISTSYSNYVLSSHKFTDDCLDRYLHEIHLALKQRDFSAYEQASEAYFHAISEQIIYINREIQFISNNIAQQKIQQTKLHDWKRDTLKKQKRLLERKDKLASYYKEVSAMRPFFRLKVALYTRKLANKYDEIIKLKI